MTPSVGCKRTMATSGKVLSAARDACKDDFRPNRFGQAFIAPKYPALRRRLVNDTARCVLRHLIIFIDLIIRIKNKILCIKYKDE